MARSILSYTPVQMALGALMGGYMALVQHTTRWEVRRADAMRAIAAEGKGAIGAFWHGRLLMSIALWPKRTQQTAILVSRSVDGDIIARAAAHHKVLGIRGSTRKRRRDGSLDDKGAMSAYRAMVRHLEEDGVMAITPDGPKGPRMRVTPGAIRLAEATGVPILAVTWSIRARKVFNSWDRFVLPFPFSRGVIIWSEPYFLPEKASAQDREAARLWLEETLITLTREADLACGVEPVEPAPPAGARSA
ncbi:MAG: lysophospholipid acyltransferase family protein [Caulobacterales bacterium]|uniref:lysophospholipid acyltransferase family protein n=1 Tax=Glycocaulis sp. TaxID=1969725 RepID=UPI003FA0C800